MIERAHRSEVYSMLRRNSNNYTLVRMSFRACTFRTASMLVRRIKCDPYMKRKSKIEGALIYLYWRLEGSSCVGCSFWELTSPGWVGESCQALVESRVDQEGIVAVMLLQLIQKNLQLTIKIHIVFLTLLCMQFSPAQGSVWWSVEPLELVSPLWEGAPREEAAHSLPQAWWAVWRRRRGGGGSEGGWMWRREGWQKQSTFDPSEMKNKLRSQVMIVIYLASRCEEGQTTLNIEVVQECLHLRT